MTHIHATLQNRPVWFDLSTTDLDASARFYGELFGWRYEREGPEQGYYTMAFAADRPAAAIVPKWPGQETTPSSWTVYFGVLDAALTAQRIKDAGGSIIMEPMKIGDAGYMGIAVDPDGAVFGLWQAGSFAGAGIEGEHGTMCWCEVNSTRAAKNAEFYSRVFELAPRLLETDNVEYYTLHQGDEAVAGVMQMDANWAGIPPHWMPYFSVQNLETANAVVQSRGGKLMHGPIPSPHGRIMVVSDPQGAVLSYMSAT